MEHAGGFLAALALVLGVAGLTTVLCQRLRQPVVLGYLVAGLIVGPHVPIPLVADADVVRTLSELGVILLMYSLGLEFSLGRLAKVGPTAGLTAVIQCSLMLWLGWLVGQALGWTPMESLFCGALISISSTTIIAKAFDEQRVGGRLRELVVGILVVEDLIAVLMMAALSALAMGGGLDAGGLMRTGGKLAFFLVLLVGGGLLLVPRAFRLLARHSSAETLLVASVGFCFAVALLAMKMGYSVALGAFLAGTLVAESGEGQRIEHLVRPVRDIFAAVFFVSVGMLLDPALALRYGLPVLVLTAVVVAGKVASVTLGAFLSGHGVRTSVQSGLSMAQIGEFSFIIAALGISLGATRDFLYTVAVSVSAATTLATPWLIRASGPAAEQADRLLPRPLQTFASLYGSWLERLRAKADRGAFGGRLRALARVLALDTLAVLLVAWMASAYAPDLKRLAGAKGGWSPPQAQAGLALLAGLAALPFLLGIVRAARALGAELAGALFPAAAPDAVDLAQAPRKALVTVIQMLLTLLVGLPLLALAPPLLRGWQAGAVLVGLLALLAWVFWRHAADLQGHVRAGSALLAEAIQRGLAPAEGPTSLPGLLSGLGDPLTLKLPEGCRACGRSLAQLRLRGATGATVLMLVDREGKAAAPAPGQALRGGDTLVLAGTQEALEAAKALLLAAGEDEGRAGTEGPSAGLRPAAGSPPPVR